MTKLQQQQQHPFNGPFPGLAGWAGTRKVKIIWILLKQETVSGSGISWAIYKSALRSRQITMPAPNHSVFYRPDALPAAQPTASRHWRQWHWRQSMILHLWRNYYSIIITRYHLLLTKIMGNVLYFWPLYICRSSSGRSSSSIFNVQCKNIPGCHYEAFLAKKPTTWRYF